MDKFKQLESFVAVAALGSLSAAARVEGIAPAMIGRRISELETRLGVKLLNRTTRRLSLTSEGSALLEEAQRMAASAAASREARLRGQLNALRHAPRPDCALPAGRLHDYADAIRAANQLDAPVRVPDRMPSTANPGRP